MNELGIDEEDRERGRQGWWRNATRKDIWTILEAKLPAETTLEKMADPDRGNISFLRIAGVSDQVRGLLSEVNENEAFGTLDGLQRDFIEVAVTGEMNVRQLAVGDQKDVNGDAETRNSEYQRRKHIFRRATELLANKYFKN